MVINTISIQDKNNILLKVSNNDLLAIVNLVNNQLKLTVKNKSNTSEILINHKEIMLNSENIDIDTNDIDLSGENISIINAINNKFLYFSDNELNINYDFVYFDYNIDINVESGKYFIS